MVLPRSLASFGVLVLRFDQVVVISSGLNLRATFDSVDATASSSSANAVDLFESRSLEGVDLPTCYKEMVATAKHDVMTKEGYYYFSDVMSNQWFSDNKIYSFDELSYDMKYSFTTLACKCSNYGGDKDCCQGHRASLDISGADGQEVTQEQTDNLNDICTLTYRSIGPGRMNPAPAEMPVTKPTLKPSNPFHPIVTPPTPAPLPVNPGGLGPGGAIGIALSAAAVLALLLYLISGRKDDEEKEDENLEDIVADDLRKVDVRADLDKDAPDRVDSPDGTKSMTNSVLSEQSTIVTAANAIILPGMDSQEDESEIFTDDGQPSEIPSDTSSLSRCVRDVVLDELDDTASFMLNCRILCFTHKIPYDPFIFQLQSRGVILEPSSGIASRETNR